MQIVMKEVNKSKPTSDLLADPVAVYKNLSIRLEQDGGLTPMPEFEPAVRFLQAELTHPDIVNYCEGNPFADGMRQLALNALWHTDLDFEVSPETGGYHQHQPPARGRFPYLPTLQAIDEAIGFFDTFERATKVGHDFHYQLDRYRYHGLDLPHIGGWVVMPTNDALSLKDLIIARAAPVGLTMVSSRTSFLDAYFNSPLNAKIHDDNHNRRMNSENQRFFLENNIQTPDEKMAAYEQFQDTIRNTILPSIEIKPDMEEGEKNIRKAMSILYFELLHEYAKTPDRETLKTELMFQPDGPSAFEVILQKGEKSEDLESRRLDNKNLDSGSIFAKGKTGGTVYYFMDKGRNFLTSAYNKVTHGFFDNGKDDFEEAPPLKAQTPNLFADATERIMRDFKLTAEETGLTREKILSLLLNKSEDDILGKNLETYPGHDPENPLNKAPRPVSKPKESDAYKQRFLLG